MTDLDLDDVLAHAHDNCSVCEGTGVVRCWSPGGPCPDGQTVCESCGPCQQSDVPALVDALREARAEVERLNLTLTQTERDYRSVAAERDETRKRLNVLHGNASRWRRERDDWRRRYKALRDGVLAVEPADLADGIDYLRAVVARVEGDES